MTEHHLKRSWTILSMTIFVGAYRATSLWQAEDLKFSVVLNLVGLCFLSAGVYFWLYGRFSAHKIAAIFLILQALHWGGPVIIGSRLASLVIYLLLSGVLAETCLLHLAVVFKSGSVSHRLMGFIYGPFAITVLIGLAVILSLLAPEQFLMAHGLIGIVIALATLTLLLTGDGLSRWFAVSLLIAWIPTTFAPLVASALGEIDIAGRGSEPLNVFFVAIPIGFVLAERLICGSSRVN